MARVSGLDLSLTAPGVAEVTGRLTARAAVITPGKKLGHERLQHHLDQLRPWWLGSDLVMVEGPAYNQHGTGGHGLAGLWWLVCHELWRAEVPYVVVTPNQLKKYATGFAGGPKSGKDRVLSAAIRRFPVVDDLNDNNAADALWLAAMGADRLGEPLAAVPQAQRAVLEAITWPDLRELRSA